ncbi:3-dehydroquinate dehydratase [Sinobaca qinghaiensis]|uniref:3-dehydroquinate dehydratase n=1 Tax=Sinobaca qinghaiensis TaxID=342944 RepID=A0A419V5I1_9BACL|nr:type I 3-dehydroquinate dehydratase [Sinobaca qinghaiensis]RKD75157.1 3-dehydroquinate dehydratase [Sinobaca qinghaiensis]
MTTKAQSLDLHKYTSTVCTALVGKTAEELDRELDIILPKEPDVLEWRADHLETLADTGRLLKAADSIRKRAGKLPIIFTIRSVHEGGETIDIDEEAKVEVLQQIAASGSVSALDYEWSNNRERVTGVQNACRKHGIKCILSYHNFQETPSREEMIRMLKEMAEQKPDYGKLAVMPQNNTDVLQLLDVTEEITSSLEMPIITMAMGPLGGITRLAGWQYGSVLTFAVGSSSSAPGQIPIDLVRRVEQALK